MRIHQKQKEKILFKREMHSQTKARMTDTVVNFRGRSTVVLRRDQGKMIDATLEY